MGQFSGVTLTILISFPLFHKGDDEDHAGSEEDDAAGKAQDVATHDI